MASSFSSLSGRWRRDCSGGFEERNGSAEVQGHGRTEEQKDRRAKGQKSQRTEEPEDRRARGQKSKRTEERRRRLAPKLGLVSLRPSAHRPGRASRLWHRLSCSFALLLFCSFDL